MIFYCRYVGGWDGTVKLWDPRQVQSCVGSYAFPLYLIIFLFYLKYA